MRGRHFIAAVACAWMLCGCGKPATKTAPPGNPFQVLVGQWVRPDGGYVLEIKSVAADGKLEAGYFNPNPIHIAKAVATKEGATIKVFVEFADVNYTGSTYTLTYSATNDALTGIYYQATMQQRYDVEFVRQ